MDKRQWGGIGFVVGNLALIANGLIAHQYGDDPRTRQAGAWRAASNVGLGLGGLALAHWGHQPVERQQTKLEEKLAAYLQSEGVPLDAAMLKHADAHTQRGWFQKIEDFIFDHPIECVNAYTGLVSTGMAVSGVLRRRQGNKESGDANIGFAALTVAGVLASILIPERTPAQLAAEGKSGLVAKIQERPLNYVRFLFMGADALEGKEAWGEYKAAKSMDAANPYRPWQFRMSALSLTAMASFLLGDWLTGADSKKQAGTPVQHTAGQAKIIQAAAHTLAQQPPERLEMLAERAATYLARQPGLRFIDRPAKEIAEDIRKAAQAEMLGPHTRKTTAAPAHGFGLS